MFYITASSSITHQPAFRNPGFSKTSVPLAPGSELLSPDYKAYIDAGLLRRMSRILRMSVACARDCMMQAAIRQPDAIVVGTGLGCLLDTEKFLNNALTIEGLLPPTSFIQSTHNTMAGQISLSLGNHGYNMTHTQNTISFENALQDAMLLLGEEQKCVLVGAADEHITFLDEVSGQLLPGIPVNLTSGASFFLLTGEKPVAAGVAIRDSSSFTFPGDRQEIVRAFLDLNDTAYSDLELILFSGSAGGKFSFDRASDIGFAGTYINYTELAGLYPTSSAFALHYATDRILHDPAIRRVLICNTLSDHHIGLTLVESVEA